MQGLCKCASSRSGDWRIRVLLIGLVRDDGAETHLSRTDECACTHQNGSQRLLRVDCSYRLTRDDGGRCAEHQRWEEPSSAMAEKHLHSGDVGTGFMDIGRAKEKEPSAGTHISVPPQTTQPTL